jgi:hypothetical protein
MFRKGLKAKSGFHAQDPTGHLRMMGGLKWARCAVAESEVLYLGAVELIQEPI